MATPSVATSGSTHGLWVSSSHVLTIGLDKASREFPPSQETCAALNGMIEGLARAVRAVIFHAENDARTDPALAMQPITDIANTIILLSQLSAASASELNRDEVAEKVKSVASVGGVA